MCTVYVALKDLSARGNVSQDHFSAWENPFV